MDEWYGLPCLCRGQQLCCCIWHSGGRRPKAHINLCTVIQTQLRKWRAYDGTEICNINERNAAKQKTGHMLIQHLKLLANDTHLWIRHTSTTYSRKKNPYAITHGKNPEANFMWRICSPDNQFGGSGSARIRIYFGQLGGSGSAMTKTLDPDPYPDPHWNECGSATLQKIISISRYGTCQSGWLERNSLASLLPPARIFSSSASFHLSIVTDLRSEYFNLTRLPWSRCCGTGAIYSVPGSDFGNVSVPFPDPGPDPDQIKHSFPTTNAVQNLTILMLEAALLPRKLCTHFWFFVFCHPILCRIRIQMQNRTRNSFWFRFT